jgi:thioredoxin-like negative regulator of GroEL
LLELGRAQLQSGSGEDAAATISKLLEAEKSDALNARAYLVSAYMDEGLLGEARAVLEQTPPHQRPPEEWYSLALIEFIAWVVLEEEGASEEAALHALKVATPVPPLPFPSSP